MSPPRYDHWELENAILSIRSSFKALDVSAAKLEKASARQRTRLFSHIMEAHASDQADESTVIPRQKLPSHQRESRWWPGSTDQAEDSETDQDDSSSGVGSDDWQFLDKVDGSIQHAQQCSSSHVDGSTSTGNAARCPLVAASLEQRSDSQAGPSPERKPSVISKTIATQVEGKGQPDTSNSRPCSGQSRSRFVASISANRPFSAPRVDWRQQEQSYRPDSALPSNSARRRRGSDGREKVAGSLPVHRDHRLRPQSALSQPPRRRSVVLTRERPPTSPTCEPQARWMVG